MEINSNSIIFFDGLCNLCNGFLQLIILHDRKKKFRFASLQSVYAASFPILKDKIGSSISTVVLQQGDKYFYKSTAVLRIAKLLKFPILIAYLFIIIPRPLRGAIYLLVANKRYKWFGQRDSCLLPTPELKNRFLN